MGSVGLSVWCSQGVRDDIFEWYKRDFFLYIQVTKVCGVDVASGMAVYFSVQSFLINPVVLTQCFGVLLVTAVLYRQCGPHHSYSQLVSTVFWYWHKCHSLVSGLSIIFQLFIVIVSSVHGSYCCPLLSGSSSWDWSPDLCHYHQYFWSLWLLGYL